MSALDSLMEMGFPKVRAEKALAVTGNQGVPPAMEWLFAHGDDADIDEPYVAPQGHRLAGPPESSSQGAAAPTAGPAVGADSDAAAPAESESGAGPESAGGVASSLKCDECGKQLRDSMAAQAHATRTGHSQFSESVEEIKPLTEEEKAEQKARLQERLTEKRRLRAEEERQNAIAAEKMRRRSGRDVLSAKEQFDQQRKLLDAQTRRREMQEEKKAKDAIMAKVAADKAERAAMKARPAASAAAAAAPAAVSQQAGRDVGTSVDAPPVKKQYTECKVRVRLPDGQAVMQTFSPSDTLTAVMQFVRSRYSAGAFSLKTAMPPKTFQGPDLNQTLQTLNLMPSANLIVVKL